MSSMLRLGSRGAEVHALQSMLRRHSPALVCDSIFGPRTERAVRLSQRREGLYPPDGIAGPLPMGALTKVLRPVARAAIPDRSTRAVPVPAQRAAFTATPPVRVVATGDPGPLHHAVEPARQRAKTGAMPSGGVLPVSTMRP